MSATGRGTTRDPKDYYSTPRAAFAPLIDILPRDKSFWEPCAGDGRLIRWLRESGREVGGVDFSPQRQEIYPMISVDYLTDFTQREFIVTNPPFSLAFEMCQHAKITAFEFMFLLRLSFLESEERGDWLAANEPGALFVLRKRPSFVMSVTCKTPPSDEDGPMPCKHNWLLAIESERPKVCPKCGGTRLAISTSDNAGYAWFYWGHRYSGIHHI